ncbi:beta strand repeat-containing protein [Silvibacterium acidisoli]|uniref:beta strand repeat-containing protein n=1 Tax=Acidobacteriaceae bacterium ZG23-2 TaxID=2883246 RepID=UPI00406CF1CA
MPGRGRVKASLAAMVFSLCLLSPGLFMTGCSGSKTTSTTSAATTLPVLQIALPDTASVMAGATTTVTSEVLPANATNPALSWKSSNTAVATVNSTGVVTGVSTGTAQITAVSTDGSNITSNTCTVTVTPGNVSVTSIAIPSSASVVVGATTTVTATVLPSDATNPAVSWQSSNTAVATVNSTGVVTAVSTGTAQITAASTDGSNITSNIDAVTVTSVPSVSVTGTTPIPGATATLYSTGSTGYGAAATVLGTATADDNGNFAIPASVCSAGSQVYVTATDVNNPNTLLLAAIGSCSTLAANNAVVVNEATTVAAAYALRPFIAIAGGAVNIGAPAVNNSSTPACTGTGSSMTCTASGLAHAFLNALSLVNSAAASAPAGTVYTTSPYNGSASIPTALVNSLADATNACTSSSSSCASLFTAATPPGGSAPTNTLQALMNIAQYPSQNVASIYSLASSVSVYSPALTAAPPDWTLAVVYSGITANGTPTPFENVRMLALDAADNVYAVAAGATDTTVTGMSSNGVGSFVYTDTTYISSRILVADAIGNLFFTNYVTAATDDALVEVSNKGVFENAIVIGSPYSAFGAAVDKYNNVYVASEITASKKSPVFVIPAGSTTATAAMAGGSQAALGSYPHALAVDPFGDVWAAADTTGVTSVTLISDAPDGASTPSFSSAASVTESSTLSNGYDVTFDSSGNAWVGSYTTLFEVPVTASSQAGSTVTPAVVASTPSQQLPITGLKGDGTTATSGAITNIKTDGANNIFLPDYNQEYLWRFMPAMSGGTFVALRPCAAPNSQTTCNAGTTAGTYPALYTPEDAVVDATGAVWVPNYTSKSITQVFGVAAPAWPQISYGHPGVSPQ